MKSHQLITAKAFTAPETTKTTSPATQIHLLQNSDAIEQLNHEQVKTLIQLKLETIRLTLCRKKLTTKLDIDTEWLIKQINELTTNIQRTIDNKQVDFYQTIEQIIWLIELIQNTLEDKYPESSYTNQTKQVVLKHYKQLFTDADKCLPGYHDSLMVLYYDISNGNTIDYWLTKMRGELVLQYASSYCQKFFIPKNMEKHILSQLLPYATENEFSVLEIPGITQIAKDIFAEAPMIKVNDTQLEIFLQWLREQYNPLAIIGLLHTELVAAINTTKQQVFADSTTLDGAKLQEFTDLISPVLRQFDLSVHDVVSLNSDNQAGIVVLPFLRLRIVNKLCHIKLFDFSSLGITWPTIASDDDYLKLLPQLLSLTNSSQHTELLKLLIGEILNIVIFNLAPENSNTTNILNDPALLPFITMTTLLTPCHNRGELGATSGLYRLACSDHGRVLLSRIFAINEQLSGQISLNDIAHRPQHSPDLGDTVLYWLSSSIETVHIVANILLDSQMKKVWRQCETALCQPRTTGADIGASPLYWLSSTEQGQKLLESICLSENFIPLNTEGLYTPITTGIHQGERAITKLCSTKSGRNIVAINLDHETKLALEMPAEVFYEQENASRPINLFWFCRRLAEQQHDSLLTKILQINHKLVEQIETDEINKPYPDINNESILFWLCYHNQTSTYNDCYLLDQLINSHVDLLTGISLADLCQPVLTEGLAGLSSLYLLTTRENNIKILAKIIENSTMEDAATIGAALCRTFQPVWQKTFTPLYNLSRTELGCQTLKQLLTANPGIINHLSANALYTIVINDVISHFTTLFWLCQHPTGQEILELLINQRADILNEAHASKAFYAMNTYGKYSPFTPFFALVGTANGRRLLKSIFTQSNLGAKMDLNDLYHLFESGPYENTSCFYWLCGSKTGLEIIEILFNQNPALTKAPDDSILAHKSMPPYLYTSAYRLLKQSEAGRKILKQLTIVKFSSPNLSVKNVVIATGLFIGATLFCRHRYKQQSYNSGYTHGQMLESAIDIPNNDQTLSTDLTIPAFKLVSFSSAILAAALVLLVCCCCSCCSAGIKTAANNSNSDPEPPQSDALRDKLIML